MTNTTTPITAHNIAVVQRFIDEVLNRGRFELLDELCHEDYRYVGPDGETLHGRAALAELLGGFRSAFSDLRADVKSVVATDDTVAMTMTLTGTHDGVFAGIGPTGASLDLPLAIFTTMIDGAIAVDREFYDSATLLSQIGVGTDEAGPDNVAN